LSSIGSNEKERVAGVSRRRIVRPEFGSRLALLTQEQGVFLIAGALGLFFFVSQPGFASWGNVMALLRGVSVLGLLSLGMAVVIIGRGIDLSQIAIALVSTGITIKLVLSGIGLPISIFAGFMSALALGLVNGAIVTFLKIPALFATLATGFLFVGVARSTILTSMITNLPTDNVALMSLGQNWLGVPAPLIIMLSSAIGLHWFLSWTTIGRFIYAHGDNPETAMVTGLPVRLLAIVEYCLSAAICYIAGLIMSASTGAVDLRAAGSTLIFDVVLVAVLGGVSLAGGRGSVRSVIAGTLLIGVLLNGMTIMNLDYQIQNIIKGVVLLVAIILDNVLHPRDEETARQGD
jgi:ribose transport system permease protein